MKGLIAHLHPQELKDVFAEFGEGVCDILLDIFHSKT